MLGMNGWVLKTESGKHVACGDIVGDGQYILEGGTPPHKPQSLGFVQVRASNPKLAGFLGTREYYASVARLVWVKAS